METLLIEGTGVLASSFETDVETTFCGWKFVGMVGTDRVRNIAQNLF